MYSGLQKSMDGHYIRMKWPYFQSLKNVRNTAHKTLKLFWLNAQHSEVSKMLCYALLARLLSRPCTKSSQSYEKFAVLSKNGLLLIIFAENSIFFVALRQLCAGSRRDKRA